MNITAAELMAKLKQDKEYTAQQMLRDEENEKLERLYSEDEKSMMLELSQLGFKLVSVWDFVNRENDYISIVPVLKKHLLQGHHAKVLSGIARALAIPALSHDDDLWNSLVCLYESTPSDAAIEIPVERGAQEAVAVALRALAKPSRVEILKSLVVKYPEGDGVSHFIKRIEELQ